MLDPFGRAFSRLTAYASYRVVDQEENVYFRRKHKTAISPATFSRFQIFFFFEKRALHIKQFGVDKEDRDFGVVFIQ